VGCGENLTCVGGACVCISGQTVCSGNGVQTCDASGQWDPPVDCGSTLTCVGGACTGVCGPGEAQCWGSGIEMCDAYGQWGAPVTCGAAAPFCVAGECTSTPPTGPLTISPLADVITVAFGQQTPTVTYVAEVQGPGGGQVVPASFSIDLGQVAAIDPSTGILTPSGAIGGVAHVTATFGGETASTTVTVKVTLLQNGAPAGVDAGGSGGNNGVGGSPAGGPVTNPNLGLLQGSTTTDSNAWLYPYNNTVWPQGVLPPLLQWTAPKTYDSIYIQLQEQAFYYQGFFSAPVAGQPFINIPLLQTAWNTLCYSNQGPSDPVTVTLIFTSNGAAYGPLTETWTIAQGTLTGTVYYNSYGTALAINFHNTTAGLPNFGGATLAIKHGALSPVLVAGSSVPGATPTGIPTSNTSTTLGYCRVCHSVAARGSELVTQHGEDYQFSSAYALSTTYTETVMPESGTGTYAFPAIYPDGTFLLSNTGPLPGVDPPSTSGLFSINLSPPGVGVAIPSTGLSGLGAATPVFSPDGTHIAFNHYGGTIGGVAADQKSIGAMDFAEATSTFSNFRTLYTPSGSLPALFPSFLPTNNAVVFELETSSDGEFGATRSQSYNSTGPVSRGNLWWVDLATHKAAELATLNGDGYLPTSSATYHTADQTLQYEPTVNPVPSGGYAWVVFTSRRMYGNVATQDPFLSDPRHYNATLTPTTKKLWVAAIDLNATPGTDPSHPAFYLPGQELLAGNSRGYWVVDPCEASGVACSTGDECCSGYCGQTDGGMMCGTQPPGCVTLGNVCTSTAACCGSAVDGGVAIACIDGYCATQGPS
jgi:hypothetical protein